MTEVGLVDGRPPFVEDDAATAAQSGASRPMEAAVKEEPRLGTDESIDIWRELKRGISVKEEEGEGEEAAAAVAEAVVVEENL